MDQPVLGYLFRHLPLTLELHAQWGDFLRLDNALIYEPRSWSDTEAMGIINGREEGLSQLGGLPRGI
jgi:hypothetical protein